MDDALESWVREFPDLKETHGWDMMLKKVTIEWSGSLSSGERLDIDAAVTRVRRTSWEVAFTGTCEGRPVFSANVVYVSVVLGDGTPMETPAEIREFLGAPN